tara:strand:- start:617 stop:1030 length:414 start_codon:yes stop_codon:yes gene_type:complete
LIKLSLDIEEDYDFDLFGICCHLKDYRLCWELNQSCKFGLKKVEDLELSVKNEVQAYSFYEYNDHENLLYYFLINNRSDYGYLIPEEKNCDYLLIVKGNLNRKENEVLISKINQVKQILAVYPIQVGELKSKKNLIF